MIIILPINQLIIQRNPYLQKDRSFSLHHYTPLEKDFQVKVKKATIMKKFLKPD